jgi:hypothetical protein
MKFARTDCLAIYYFFPFFILSDSIDCFLIFVLHFCWIFVLSSNMMHQTMLFLFMQFGDSFFYFFQKSYHQAWYNLLYLKIGLSEMGENWSINFFFVFFLYANLSNRLYDLKKKLNGERGLWLFFRTWWCRFLFSSKTCIFYITVCFCLFFLFDFLVIANFNPHYALNIQKAPNWIYN